MGTYYYESSQGAYPPYLAHYGVKGMKWGVRRYYNDDGSLNERGIRRRERRAIKYQRLAARTQLDQANNLKSLQDEAVHKMRTKAAKGMYKPTTNLRDEYNREFSRNYLKFTASNKYYKRSKKMIKKYGAENISALAVRNERDLKALRDYVDGKITYQDAYRIHNGGIDGLR